ncbi:MAG: hypothetical protein U0990_10940 [Candidatus Nanopelagicales bacterium]|nr:hypothetical protein [Candidatus Nanopelagicales bacterium]MDZ4250582.1 hypothetical protein [Candidatus Nanopelagicales bacterium]
MASEEPGEVSFPPEGPEFLLVRPVSDSPPEAVITRADGGSFEPELMAYVWAVDGELVKQQPPNPVVWPTPQGPLKGATLSFGHVASPWEVDMRVFRGGLGADGVPSSEPKIVTICDQSVGSRLPCRDDDGWSRAFKIPEAADSRDFSPYVVVFAQWSVLPSDGPRLGIDEPPPNFTASWILRTR